MKLIICLTALALGLSTTSAQDANSVTQPTPLNVGAAGEKQTPRLVRYSGHLEDINGKPVSGLIEMTLALYSEETDGTPLWIETQNVNLDTNGRFTVLLGSSNPQGMPADIFASGEARWLGMSGEDGVERPRVQLVSVPYAIESVNAETLGGRRPEEFVSADQFQGWAQGKSIRGRCAIPLDGSISGCDLQAPPGSSMTAPIFEATSATGPSFLSDATIGPPFRVQSPEMVPKLNVDLLHGLSASDFAQTNSTNQFSMVQAFNGGISLERLPFAGGGEQISPPLDFAAKVFDSATKVVQDHRFRWQLEPADDTSAQLDRLSLLFALGANPPTETSLSINADGTINFASNQQFAASGEVGPAAGTGTDYSTTYQWQQTPPSGSIVAGQDTITLAHCPPGVNASTPSLYVYISGTGTPEAVQVTGGTCKGDGQPGTLQFVAASAHPAGFTVSSASSGLQEAIAAVQPTQGGSIVVPPGEYAVRAPITILVSNLTIDFSGSTIDCYAVTSCIVLGDLHNSNAAQNITLINPRGKPMVSYGTSAFIEVDAQKTRIQNVTTRYSPPPNSFGSYVQVDDDQSFLLDGLDSSLGYGVRCDATFCGSYVTAPGPFNIWSAVGWLKNLNLSLQCDGSGVDWQSGNGLQISDSVIQGWSLFGVRVGNKRGGYGGFVSSNVYYEPGDCESYNPWGNIGLAGIIDQGGTVNMEGVPSNGVSGVFPNWGATSGSAEWLYWVAPVHPTYGDGVPLPAGYALISGPTTITGTFPRVAGASAYRILRMTWDMASTKPYPEGTGNYLLTTVLQTSCGPHTCQFTDGGQSLSSYFNAGENLHDNMYLPMLDFWPGAIIIGQSQDMSSASGAIFSPLLTADTLGEGAIVSTFPANIITGQAQTLIPTSVPVPAAAGLSGMNTGASLIPAATILKAFTTYNVPASGLKGRLNFADQGSAGGFYPLITLGDSNWGKTWATAIERPTADVGDLDAGYEGTISTYYQRAATEIRNYIGKFPDGNPQESLTGAAKTFNVPVVINGDLIVNGTCTGCGTAAGNTSGSEGVLNRPAQPFVVEVDHGSDSHAAATLFVPVSRVGETAGIAQATLCTPSICGAGQYQISYYVDSTAVCASQGEATVALTVSWTDETGEKSFRVPLSGSGISEGNHLSLGGPSGFGSGEISLWSTGIGPIEYATRYTPCGSGMGAYSLRMTLRHLQ